jgi:inner membrane protein
LADSPPPVPDPEKTRMDSLTQFLLGAAVSTACLGKTLGPRKAALVGGVLGTLPDLDVFIPFDDPVDSFVLHRGATHSLFIQALAAPVIGEALLRIFRVLRDKRWLVWLTVYLCLSTHAIIDAMTVYGTRLFWPLYPDPVGVGSVFIIDPLYTLPLLVVTVWALFKRGWGRTFARGLTTALVVSTAYLGLSVVLQGHMEARAKEVFARAGFEPDRVFAIAAPFTTVVWKVIGLEGERYHNVYLSLLDPDGVETPIYTHPRRPDLVACLSGSDAFEKLVWFSRGYFRAEEADGKVVVSDLRMGLTPGYAFRFAIGERTLDGIAPIPPERDMSYRRSGDGDGAWLMKRLAGEPATRAAEQTMEAATDALVPAC